MTCSFLENTYFEERVANQTILVTIDFPSMDTKLIHLSKYTLFIEKESNTVLKKKNMRVSE